MLSRDNFRRLYLRAVAKTADPATALSPTGRQVLEALRANDGQTAGELAERLAATGRRLRPATVAAWLTRLEDAGLAVAGVGGDSRCSAVTIGPGPLRRLHLSGPHDLRHTFATWLEDAGVPARVIDELMGHAGGRHAERGSHVGRTYRHTTPEMHAQVVGAVEERLAH